jgi:hypothetical protein
MDVQNKYETKGTIVRKLEHNESDGFWFIYDVHIPEFRSKYPIRMDSRFLTPDDDGDVQVSPPTGAMVDDFDHDQMGESVEDGREYWYELTLDKGSIKKVRGKEKSGEWPSDYFWIIKKITPADDFDMLGESPSTFVSSGSNGNDGVEYGVALHQAGRIMAQVIAKDPLVRGVGDVNSDVIQEYAKATVDLAKSIAESRSDE